VRQSRPGAMTLKLNDPVHVERESQPQLEGVVAHLGPVKFAEGNDWVGIKLTGSSVGMGKNDGTVQGETYFSCGPNCGVFVRETCVVPRALSRLEEVRLKKELFAPRAAAVPGVPNRSASQGSLLMPPLTKSVKSPTNRSLTSTSASTSNMKPSSSSSQSRLEEIRARRAALAADRSIQSTTASTVSIALNQNTASSDGVKSIHSNDSVTSKSKESLSEQGSVGNNDDSGTTSITTLNLQIQELQGNLASKQLKLDQALENLKKKEEELESIQKSLSKAEQEVMEYKEHIEQGQNQANVPNQTVIQISSDKMQQQLEELQIRERQFLQIQSEMQDGLDRLQAELKSTQLELSQERQGRTRDIQELTKARAELSTTQHELNAFNNQAASRSSSDASHYKERAKLQAELAAMKRANDALQAEKLDLESALEDLALDKEQLLEEKENLEDKVDELQIDAETAQMELEELKSELAGREGDNRNSVDDTDDATHALATQNARLREALIRLREQTSYEKVEMSRQLRAAEKEALDASALKKELEELKTLKMSLEEQNAYLKESVDQGSAFETMVEALSDRVLTLEDENITLQATIREMEDAADIAAELEEVQAEEVKALMIDLEARDSIIRNLEEAIKMQRRREEDFQRTVGNYRKSVETLKQEKNELLAMQRGGEGEKSEIIALSQKALTRAANLVADAAKARKKEAEYAFERVEGNVQRHLASRVQNMLPQSVVSSEIAAIKGELLLCKVVGKASITLDSLSTAFLKAIRSGINEAMTVEESKDTNSEELHVSDDAAQDIERVLHETKFSLSTISMSSELLRLLAAGQWPEVLSLEDSSELGSSLMHSLSGLEAIVGNNLKTLKEEGVLSPHRSNLGEFEQSIQTSIQSLQNLRNFNDKPLIPDNWKPPAWFLFKNVVASKFSCIGSGAAIAAAYIDDQSPSNSSVKSILKNIMITCDRIAVEASRIGPRLSHLDISNEKVVAELDRAAVTWKDSSDKLCESVEELFIEKGSIKTSVLSKCQDTADAVIKSISQFMSSLRAADLNSADDSTPHPLSSECSDPWFGISNLARKVRSIDGDIDDVNFSIRSTLIEQRLVNAIENEPKLATANNKISSLEKNLSSRSKELAMLNARLSELEKILTKSSVQAHGRAPTPTSPSFTEELLKLKEENRILSDAMDVLQQQVDDYEAELRSMKDPKSPKPRLATGSTPRRSLSVRDQRSMDFSSQVEVSPAVISALQATLFRPIMESIRRDAASWKANAVLTKVQSLPPLPLSGISKTTVRPRALSSFEAARSSLRLERASYRLVDLSLPKSPRAQYIESLSNVLKAETKLKEEITTASLKTMKGQLPIKISSSIQGKNSPVARIKLRSNDVSKTIPLTMTKDDMIRVHHQLVT
jgi:dynactin 1